MWINDSGNISSSKEKIGYKKRKQKRMTKKTIMSE